MRQECVTHRPDLAPAPSGARAQTIKPHKRSNPKTPIPVRPRAEFDSNSDGRLELSELRRLCDIVGRALDDGELREAIRLLGGRDSQHVYFQDFAGGPGSGRARGRAPAAAAAAAAFWGEGGWGCLEACEGLGRRGSCRVS